MTATDSAAPLPPSVSPFGLGLLVAAPFLYAIAEPLFGAAARLSVAVIAVIAAALLARRPAWLARLDRGLAQAPWRANLALALLAVVLAVGAVELAARTLLWLGWVERYEPMRTLVPAGTEDWRLAHITADRHREPDPLLLWRPLARAPYNVQRMKGPLATVPKPAGLVRVIAYGDSNTDGPDRGGWTEQLGTVLAGRTGAQVEVLNAGVAGYSSYQGLLRFRQQIAQLEPDIVLVAFGWNDLATPMGPPDRSFVPPPAWQVAIERAALRYQAFLVLRRWLLEHDAPQPAAASPAHRVPPGDYAENLLAFDRVAREHGARAVLLTRPYRLATERLAAAGGWRSRVPRYNRLLLDLAAEHGIAAIDVQAAFEAADSDFVDECHFSPAGQARMARLVADALIDSGALR